MPPVGSSFVPYSGRGMWRFEQKGLFAREKVPKGGVCKPGAQRAGREEGGWALVCVRKPISVGLQASVRKPAPGHRPVTGVSAGRSLRTKTEFSGFAGWRTQTESPLRPGSRGAGRPWFAYKNRIHWLSEEAYANREVPESGFGRGRPALVCVRKPNSLAFKGGVRKPRGP